MKAGVERPADFVLGVRDLSSWSDVIVRTIGTDRVEAVPNGDAASSRVGARASLLIRERATKPGSE